jgi:hypothetical protein
MAFCVFVFQRCVLSSTRPVAAPIGRSRKNLEPASIVPCRPQRRERRARLLACRRQMLDALRLVEARRR